MKNQQKAEGTAFHHISVAPMMDWTDRHYRYMARLISPHVRLYTEMITTGALLHGARERFLRFNEEEHPVALQLGGSDPADLAACSVIGRDFGYDEINLNCGCPSDRVQSGRFGACLMKEPDHVARCVGSMIDAVKGDVPVTVKCRIGVDDQDAQKDLDRFIKAVAGAGCDTFIIHARKAWLKGLSPKENRSVPPLDYGRIHAVKAAFPALKIIINGGIKTVAETQDHLKDLDGVMIGREAYQNPYMLAGIERAVFKNHDIKGREKIARAMIPYIERQHTEYATPVKSVTRHMIGLYHHQPGAKAWRRALSTLPHQSGMTAEQAITEALTAQKKAAVKKPA